MKFATNARKSTRLFFICTAMSMTAMTCNVAFAQRSSAATAQPGGGGGVSGVAATPTVQLIEQATPAIRGAGGAVVTQAPVYRVEPSGTVFTSAIRVCMTYNPATGSKTQTANVLHSALMGMWKQFKNKDGKSPMTGPDGISEDDFRNSQMCETLKGI